jgi:hypothetical protein
MPLTVDGIPVRRSWSGTEPALVEEGARRRNFILS